MHFYKIKNRQSYNVIEKKDRIDADIIKLHENTTTKITENHKKTNDRNLITN